ncbi:MAG TPA: hypothetical protein VGM43_03755 [Bryobacteraceae bacterium]|jgi:hypothetical protein
MDDLGRVCRQEWTVDAHLTLGERSQKVEMPPGSASDLSLRSTKSSRAETKSRHVTILLNAGMPVIRRGGQPDNSWGMLLSMLESILEQMPETSFRVVAFDSQRQRELFRKDNFTAEDMNDVARVANAKQHWTVDYHASQDPAGEWHLLRDLENKEIDAPSPPDTVIYLGVPEGRFDNMPPGMPGPKTLPRFFYLKYGHPPPFPGSSRYAPSVLARGAEERDAGRSMRDAVTPLPPRTDQPDFIEQSVQHLKGKIFLISSPANFSKALAAIRR